MTDPFDRGTTASLYETVQTGGENRLFLQSAAVDGHCFLANGVDSQVHLMRREDSKMKELVSGYGETWSSQVSAKQVTRCF